MNLQSPRKRLLYVFVIFFTFFSFQNYSQVGIGTINPNGNALLDIDASSTPGGLLLPRLALTGTSNFAPLTAHVAGMTVYNTATVSDVTPGYYYNDGSRWVRLASGLQAENNWSLMGNAGTDPNNNFVGTTSDVSLRFRTSNTNVFEVSGGDTISRGKLRAMTNGTAALPVFSFTNSVSTGLFSPENGSLGLSTEGAERMRVLPDGRISVNNSAAYNFMLNSSATGGIGAIIGVSVNGTALQGQATGNGDGVRGLASRGTGVYGRSSASDDFGGYFFNNRNNGTGMLVAGGNGNAYYLPLEGTGAGITGRGYGSTHIATEATGTGLAAAGNNITTLQVHPNGSGVAGTGRYFGVYGSADIGLTDDGFGGYFISNYNGLAAIGGWLGNTQYKIIGNGAVSTIVKDVNDESVVMFAPEAPEILLQDYGVGKLVNGQARITIDPILSRNIKVDVNHPLKVFIQLEGDCKGVYVTDKTAEGFTVKELQNGTSNVFFSWQVVATRANGVAENVNGETRISDNSVRFPALPKNFQQSRMKVSMESKSRTESYKEEARFTDPEEE